MEPGLLSPFLSLVSLLHGGCSELSETILAPLFGADSVVDEKKAVRIVSLFDFDEPGGVVTPVGVLKIGIEVVGLGDVRATITGDSSEFVHAAVHCVGGLAPFRDVGFVIGNPGIRRALAVGN